ncbi:embryo defective 2737 [Actinidia rufa]|uniref:Embryo defective 2737 n=1 Tax=Actinidia rufa TaxID=165716 RepID=A0A7J0GNT2_9ERIC|nr:embryo defective 2737 [Actinidia rufa]
MWRGVPRPPPKGWKRIVLLQYLKFSHRYGQQLLDIIDFPIKLILSPITIAFDIAGSAPRGFGVPEFISKLSYSAVFAVATFGTYDIALELGKKVLCQSFTGVQRALAVIHFSAFPRVQRAMPRWELEGITSLSGCAQFIRQCFSGKEIVGPAVDGRHCSVPCAKAQGSGEKPTAESIADAISENRAELVHLPSTFDLHVPLPSKDCPNCDGSGAMRCPECKDKIPLRISADDVSPS